MPAVEVIRSDHLCGRLVFVISDRQPEANTSLDCLGGLSLTLIFQTYISDLCIFGVSESLRTMKYC